MPSYAIVPIKEILNKALTYLDTKSDKCISFPQAPTFPVLVQRQTGGWVPNMSKALRFCIALASMLIVTPAMAMTITISNEDFFVGTFPANVDITPYSPDATAPDLTNIVGTVQEGVAGTVGGQPQGSNRRSPWQYTNDGVINFSNTGLYTAVQDDSSGDLVLPSLKSTLQFAWGSPDAFNTITFFNSVTLESASMIGTNLANFTVAPSIGVNFVTLFVLGGFDKVTFSTTRDAFEIANLHWFGGPNDLGPVVPLPAGLILLLSGLMGLGFLGRSRAKIA